jgi:hypothetical protein
MTGAGIFDDAFCHSPVRKIFVFSFFLGFDDISREVAPNMLHTFIPAAFTFEDSATETTSAALGRLSLLYPASISHIFKTVLKSSPVLRVTGVGREVG